MASTEFLLYLVSAALVVVLIMNWSNDSDERSRRSEANESRRQREHDRLMSKLRNQLDNNDNASQQSQQSQQIQGMPGTRRRVNVNVNNANHGHGMPGMPIDPLRKFDYDAIHDEFTPPFRRSYYDDYPLHPGLYPTYTRGPPGRFRKVGTLSAQGVSTNDKYKFMNLIGRQKYNNREYEYYVTSTDKESKVKFYIDSNDLKIRDGDIVKVKQLEGYTYKFTEDEDLSPKYDPYYAY
jgi:hypothetical protein